MGKSVTIIDTDKESHLGTVGSIFMDIILGKHELSMKKNTFFFVKSLCCVLSFHYIEREKIWTGKVGQIYVNTF